MLVLFETPAGYSLFKITDDHKFQRTDAEDLHETFFRSSSEAANHVQLVSFEPFADTAHAVAAATACVDGTVTKSLQKFLKKQLSKQQQSSSSRNDSQLLQLAVADKQLAVNLKQQPFLLLNEQENQKNQPTTIVHNAKTQELFRGIRCYMEDLLLSSEESSSSSVLLSKHDLRAMQLGLSHSLGRYKLKFSADKVDTMVIQAVGLLDELDKEINTYAMRVKEWYGWHFPELQGILVVGGGGDNTKRYCKLVLECGFRENYQTTDLSHILEDETVEAAVKEAAEISMGTEVADLDIINIKALAEQVLSMTEYRAQLFEYLKNRMNAIAPNLTILVGELVGARLISHAGSLMNLAKQPASTVQILGAEKALFRALKTKHDTPKYGLIYHASLIGQAAPKHKGKISRVLAAKAALAIRVDALSDETEEGHGVDTTIGFEGRAKVEARLRQLESVGGGGATTLNGSLTASKTAKYDPVVARAAAAAPGYSAASDMVLLDTTKDERKDVAASGGTSAAAAAAETENGKDDKEEEKKRAKKEKKEKKKKRKAEEMDEEQDDDEAKRARKAAKKAKKKKRKSKESSS